jgi:hypothetical protein
MQLIHHHHGEQECVLRLCVCLCAVMRGGAGWQEEGHANQGHGGELMTKHRPLSLQACEASSFVMPRHLGERVVTSTAGGAIQVQLQRDYADSRHKATKGQLKVAQPTR